MIEKRQELHVILDIILFLASLNNECTESLQEVKAVDRRNFLELMLLLVKYDIVLDPLSSHLAVEM